MSRYGWSGYERPHSHPRVHFVGWHLWFTHEAPLRVLRRAPIHFNATWRDAMRKAHEDLFPMKEF